MFIDQYVPIPGFLGNAPHAKLSTWLNIVGGITLPAVGQKLVLDPDQFRALEAAGGNMFSNVLDYLEDYYDLYFAPTPDVRRASNIRQSTVTRSRPTRATRLSPSGQQGVSVKAPVVNGSRYVVTG
jgi:hypothetical protein